MSLSHTLIQKTSTDSLRSVLIAFFAILIPGEVLFGQVECFELSAHGSGRATAYSKSNKIVTWGDKTHVAWLDSDDNGFVVRIRTLDNTTGQWSKLFDIGNGFDNHGGPALAIDNEGYLHVVYGPHHGPMSYKRSIHPNDASQWSEESKFGERLTYPALVVGNDNTLIVVCRKSFSNKPWCVVQHTKKPGENWSKAKTLLSGDEGGYSQFHVSLAWGPEHKTLHLATRMYGDNPRWGYKVGYMQSTDLGATWSSNSGSEIKLPADRRTIDTIYSTPPEQRAKHSSGSAVAGGLIAVDSKNKPHVLFHTLKANKELPHQAWIASPNSDRTGWDCVLLNDKIDARAPGASLSTPGGFSIASDGRWHLALTMTIDPESAESPFGVSQNEVVWARSSDAGQTFESMQLSSNKNQVPDWLPNIERSTGFNKVNNPGVIFTSGIKGAKLTDILENHVYWYRAN